jgi:hypothetical protein
MSFTDEEIREELERQYGEDNVFDTDELQEKYTVDAFLAPYITAHRKSDNVQVTLEFTGRPRFYFNPIEL